MRIIRGLAEAKAFVAGRGNLLSQEVPPHLVQEVARRSQAIFGHPYTVPEVVARILEEVRTGGDAALKDLTLRIDGIRMETLETPKEALPKAAEALPKDLRDALELSARRVTSFARASLPKSWHDPSTGLGERVVPLDRVGVYAPGGNAPYPSTVVMSVCVARAAGVREVIVCTPARDGVNPSPVVLAAAHIAGADRVFALGGAQGIAALAYGTESVPRVDKICGPGNIFVAMAKQQLFGQVGIDGVFGPTETVVVADDSADPVVVAADLLGQAEHDTLATPILLTTSDALLRRVETEVERQLPALAKKDIALAALNGQGALILLPTLEDAIEVSNLIAPEHVCLNVRDPWRWAERVRHAGALFVGAYSGEALGDYVAGPSHTLPTHGTARFASYLGADQFVKRFPVIALNAEDARRLAPIAAAIGYAEGFTAHAKSAELRAQ
ncbi:MAG: histidinol dehydrogenase [Chloroflexi bacterium]|nr:histidinol dehydrogenase [Chloroflexota bacterium]